MKSSIYCKFSGCNEALHPTLNRSGYCRKHRGKYQRRSLGNVCGVAGCDKHILNDSTYCKPHIRVSDRGCKKKGCNVKVGGRNKSGYCKKCSNYSYGKICFENGCNKHIDNTATYCRQHSRRNREECKKQGCKLKLGGKNKSGYCNWHSIYNKGKRCAEEGCNKEVMNNAVFCRSHFNIGERNRLWKGGISFLPYPAEFNEAFKESIRERDNHICQLCGGKQNGRAHAVHHIDYDKMNTDPTNLTTLCLDCHLKTNTNRTFWARMFCHFLDWHTQSHEAVKAYVERVGR